MASIDQVGIVVAIAVLAIFLGVAFSLSAVQEAGPTVSAPKLVVEEKEIVKTPKVEEKIMEELEENTVVLEEEISMEETHEEETVMEETHEEPAGPTTHTVDVPVGTSVPGCEETNSCFSPADITINAGDTVEWDNIDSAAHTVTSGSPANGPSGVFDSSLLMADATFAFTFEDAGEYDYFCMVHPWMVGTVSVN
jgi:plastocyanin